MSYIPDVIGYHLELLTCTSRFRLGMLESGSLARRQWHMEVCSFTRAIRQCELFAGPYEKYLQLQS